MKAIPSMLLVFLFCLCALVVRPAAATSSDNLLDNPSATAGMTSWDATPNVAAVATQSQSTPDVLPHSDPNFFTMADAAGTDANMSQIIDLTTLIGTPVGFDANGWIQAELYPDMCDANITANDYGELVVEFLDPCGISLGSFATGPIGNPVLGGASYVPFSESNSIPDGAVEAVYTLNGTLVSGSFINVFYDDLSLTVDLKAAIEKSMPSDANLGDILEVLLEVENPYDSNATVEDMLPDGLKYILGTYAVDGNSVEPDVVGSKVIAEVNSGIHTITFDVQVVGVEANDSNAVNCAGVFYNSLVPDDVSCATVTLHPYEGFSKTIVDWSGTDDPCATETYVPIHTDIHWWLSIVVENIEGDEIVDMNDIVVTDRLGGDLEVDDVNFVSQAQEPVSLFDYTKKGKKKGGTTEKHHITWIVGDINDANDAELVLEISTDYNPGQGKKTPGVHEYTSVGEHCLNSGAVLKFIDPRTGFQLSAHTPEICVKVYDPDD